MRFALHRDSANSGRLPGMCKARRRCYASRSRLKGRDRHQAAPSRLPCRQVCSHCAGGRGLGRAEGRRRGHGFGEAPCEPAAAAGEARDRPPGARSGVLDVGSLSRTRTCAGAGREAALSEEAGSSRLTDRVRRRQPPWRCVQRTPRPPPPPPPLSLSFPCLPFLLFL